LSKKILLVSLLISMVCSAFVFAAVKGPISDIVYFNVRMKEEIALKDTAEGMTDIFMWGVSGPTIFGLDQVTREKLELYPVPSGSWSLLMNPVPNEAPYTVEVGGKEVFNAFAIKDIRFAMNFLINRQFAVDEILGGAGFPAYTMATQGQPGTYRYNLLATKFGFTAEGNETLAIEEITKAMEAAAALPQNSGKLIKKTDGFWYFNDEPVTIKFIIRVDDPNGRLILGEYVSNQIEKAGIKVEKLLWDRSRAGITVYGGSDPKDLVWQMYTEGWGAGATRAFWEHIVAQMYAPWYGYMPGNQVEGFWNYAQDEIDEVTLKAFTGNFLTEEEYWELALRGLELGLEEAVRIYVANQEDFYTANKSRFVDRFAYGLGDGLNEWSIKTAQTHDGVLFVTLFSAMGSLFMDAWDPIGTNGFSSVYSNAIAGNLYDPSMFESPASAIQTPLRAIPLEVDTKVMRDEDGEVVGAFEVPSNAINFDPESKSWVEVGEGHKAMSMATYSFTFGNFHHGQPTTIADFMYAHGFVNEWTTKNSEDDLRYEQGYASKLKDAQDTLIGWVVHPDNTITVYFNYNFPASKERVAGWAAPGISVSASGQAVGCAWEIIEALALLVTEGSQSGTTYAITRDPAVTEVDVLSPSCVRDVKAKLNDMINSKHIPDYIKGYVTEEEALARYRAAISFIDRYGHAYISNGPFYLSKFDTSSNFAELRAFRDPTYPYEKTYWKEYLRAIRLRIDNLDVPALSTFGMDINVMIDVSEVLYPADIAIPATKGLVVVTFITDEAEFSFDAEFLGNGLFEAVVPASALEGLPAGSYNIMAIASLEGAVPASASVQVILY